MDEAKQLFVKFGDGSVYGPAAVETLAQWAREGRIAPDAAISEDRSEWRPAASEPAIGMDAVAEFGGGAFYGPVPLAAIEDYISGGKFPEDCRVYRLRGVDDARHAAELAARDAELAARDAELAAKKNALAAASSALAADRDAIAAKDAELAAARKALEASERRAGELAKETEKHALAIDRHLERVRKLEAANGGLEKELVAVRARLAEAEAREKEARDALAEAEARIAELCPPVEAVEAEVVEAEPIDGPPPRIEPAAARVASLAELEAQARRELARMGGRMGGKGFPFFGRK